MVEKDSIRDRSNAVRINGSLEVKSGAPLMQTVAAISGRSRGTGMKESEEVVASTR